MIARAARRCARRAQSPEARTDQRLSRSGDLRLALGRPASGERKQVGPRAKFLEGLGLDADAIAPVLGSTPPSVRELLSRSRRRKKRGRGK
jgi:hypothetical protein